MREFKVGSKVKVVKWRGKNELSILGSGTVTAVPTTERPEEYTVRVRWDVGGIAEERLSVHELVSSDALPSWCW